VLKGTSFRLRALISGALMCVGLWPAVAGAEGSVAPLGPPKRHAVQGELTYFAKDEARTSLDLVMFQLSGRYVWSERFSFTGAFGIATLASSPEEGEGDLIWRPSNPEVAAHYHVPLEIPVRLTLTAGVTGPLATIDRGPDARLHRAALTYAQATDGMYTLHRWVQNRTSVIGGADVELRAQPWFSFLVEAKPILLIPSREDWYTDDVDLAVPTSVGVATGNDTARLGVRLRAVLLPTFDVDNAQLSAETFGQVHAGAWFGQARYVHNIDEPLGGERGPGSWGMHLSVGAEL
jgi:hypothetical protein